MFEGGFVLKLNKSIVFLSLILSLLAFATNANEFDKYLQDQNNAYLKDDALFEEIKAKEKKEFEKYRKTILDAYKNYRDEIAKVWGKKNTVVSNNRKWAEYHDNLQQRHVVDFEKGSVTVEVIVDKRDKNNKAFIKEKLNKAIIQTVTKDADKRSILEVAKKPDQPAFKRKESTKPVLQQQVKNKSGRFVTAQNAKSFANETTKKSLKIKRQKGSDGVERVVASTKFALIPNHIRKRAERFKTQVKKYANHFKVSPNLVFAVIETESFFNPVARSHVPAFGLMQLVPHYRAREAYRFLYNKDKILSDRFLYDANNNIELGSAYLHVLYHKHMKKIQDKKARLWCSIAAYNTGPTNVFRAVIGKYRRSVHRRYSRWKDKAIREINKMNSEQLYQHLRKKLPYSETRSYIKKVRSRMAKYSAI